MAHWVTTSMAIHMLQFLRSVPVGLMPSVCNKKAIADYVVTDVVVSLRCALFSPGLVAFVSGQTSRLAPRLIPPPLFVFLHRSAMREMMLPLVVSRMKLFVAQQMTIPRLCRREQLKITCFASVHPADINLYTCIMHISTHRNLHISTLHYAAKYCQARMQHA